MPQAATPVSFSVQPPLSLLLLAAADVVLAVQQGRSLTEALARTDTALRPGTQALGFHAMRQLGWADEIAGLLLKKSPGARLAARRRGARTLRKPAI